MSRGSDLSWSHVLFPSLSPVNCVNRTTLRLLQHEQRTSGPQSRQSSIVEGEIRGIPVVNEEASVDAGAEMVLGEDTGTSKDAAVDRCPGSPGTVGSNDDGGTSRSSADILSTRARAPTRVRGSARGIMSLHRWKRDNPGLFTKSPNDDGRNGGVGIDRYSLASKKIVNLRAKANHWMCFNHSKHTWSLTHVPPKPGQKLQKDGQE